MLIIRGAKPEANTCTQTLELCAYSINDTKILIIN